MGPTTPQQGQATDVEPCDLGAREPVLLPRLDLPPAPVFEELATPSDELPVQRPLRDEPPTSWQSPFPAPEPGAHTYQVVPPPVPVTAPAEHGFPRPAFRSEHPRIPAPAPTPAQFAMPALVRAPLPASSSLDAAAAPEHALGAAARADGVSRAVIGLLLVTAVFLFWASGMAFSAALLALAGLLVSEVAIALSLDRAPDAGRPMGATAAAATAVVLGLLALRGALGGFSDMAMVAGLFVIAAGVPALLLLGAAWFALRRAPRSLANDSLRAGAAVRFGALAAIIAAGIVVRDSFSAVPDSVLAFPIVVLVAVHAVQALRGSGRAAGA